MRDPDGLARLPLPTNPVDRTFSDPPCVDATSLTDTHPLARSNKISAGMLLFRRTDPGIEVFLAHPGGPFWQRRDLGAWTVPKGIIEEGEDPLEAARREFEEETGIVPQGPFIPLGSIRQKAGKTVHVWAWEGDADPDSIRSNEMEIEWPRKSGIRRLYPEVDRCAWFAPEVAREKINSAQAELVDRLLEAVGEGS